jgi:hypothetical protein
MTISLAGAFAQIQAGPPAPVILLDACSLLDLFRTDESQTKVPYQPRSPHQEIQDAADFLARVNAAPGVVHRAASAELPDGCGWHDFRPGQAGAEQGSTP